MAVNCGQHLAGTGHRSITSGRGAPVEVILCLECSDIQSCHDRLRALVEVKVTPIHDWSGRKAFRCMDMDGNVLEIFESLPKKQQIPQQ